MNMKKELTRGLDVARELEDDDEAICDRCGFANKEHDDGECLRRINEDQDPEMIEKIAMTYMEETF